MPQSRASRGRRAGSSVTILNYRHSQWGRSSIVLRTAWEFAYWGIPLCTVPAPTLRGGGFEEKRTGPHLRGGGNPLPGPLPHGDIPMVHSMGRSRRRTGYGPTIPFSRETGVNAAPGARFPTDIAMTALAPGRGRGINAPIGAKFEHRQVRLRSAKRGWGGGQGGATLWVGWDEGQIWSVRLESMN